jgi:YD repeat-containing protein
VVRSEDWVHADGTAVTTTWGADGAVDTRTIAADGSWTVDQDDGHGNLVSTQFDQYGNRMAVSSRDAAGETSTESFDLTNVPVLENSPEILEVASGAVYAYTLPGDLFSTPDSAAFTYELSAGDGEVLPTWLAFDASTGTLSGSPPDADIGGYRFVLTARRADGLAANVDLFLNVMAVNKAPVAMTALADQQAVQGAPFAFTIAAAAFADADLGDALGYAATLADGSPLPDWLVFDPVTLSFTGIPFGDALGGIAIRVTATDTGGASASLDFSLDVQASAGGDMVRSGQGFAYYPDNGLTVYTDALGRQTRLGYAGEGQLSSISGPGDMQGIVIDYGWNGAVSSVRDRNGAYTSLNYDSEGRLTYRATPDGGYTSWNYNDRGELLSETVYDGSSTATSRYFYDPSPAEPALHGQLRFRVSAEGRVTEYRYDAYGQLVTTLEYGSQVIDPDQLYQGMDPADVADLLAKAAPAGATAGVTRRDIERTDMSYDAHGQLAKVVRYAQVLTDASSTGLADGALETRYVYDQGGRLLSRIDGAGAATSYTYDGLGRVLSVSTGGVATSVTLYDDAGNRTVVTDAQGDSTISVYDKAGRLVAVTVQGLGTTRNYYDALGRLQMSEAPSGARSWTLLRRSRQQGRRHRRRRADARIRLRRQRQPDP